MYTDPRRRPADQKPTAEEMKRREDTRYYHWLRSTGIPGSQRNVQYYLQLIATIKTDIDTSDAQMNAIHAMSADPYQSQTLQNMSKMRKQMVTKMHDCQAKLEKQKKNVMSLYAQKAEYEQRLDIPVQGCTQMNNRTHTRGVDFNQNTRYGRCSTNTRSSILQILFSSAARHSIRTCRTNQ